MVSLFSRLLSTSNRAVRDLYTEIVTRARSTEYFLEWGVPDTPNGRFEVLVLHLFLVMHRLRSEDGLSKFARAISEEAVLDMDRNLREMGVGDLSVGRKVKTLAEMMYGRFGAYTDGIEGDDEALSEAIRCYLFADFEPTEDVVLAVVRFVRAEAERLYSIDSSWLLEGKLSDEGLSNVM
ncbi:MAG: ubiquinol-cytochrome C chaperone family protein [Pseudomonadota bacterium]|nr:ubiquinol-cytochrome C chaperone family protein [Pseudomonadota bacterium]